jgi:hypothetical protein
MSALNPDLYPYPVFSYLNHSIELTENFFFHVVGPEFETQDIYFESRRSAMQEIHSRVHAATVARAANPHDKHEILLPDGTTAYITRINPRTGRLLGFENILFLYPNIDWIKALLAKRRALQGEINKIEHALEKTRIPTTRTRSAIFSIPWLQIRLETELREKRDWAARQIPGEI